MYVRYLNCKDLAHVAAGITGLLGHPSVPIWSLCVVSSGNQLVFFLRESIYFILFILGFAGFSLLLRLFSSFCTQASHCDGFSYCGVQPPGHVGSVVVAHGLRCSMVCRIFLDQGSNPCLLHWQVDSLPVSHQGSL